MKIEGISNGRSFNTNINNTMLTNQRERVDQTAKKSMKKEPLENWTHGETAAVGVVIGTPVCIGLAFLTWPVSAPIVAKIAFGTLFGAGVGAFIGYAVKGFK